MKDCTTCKYGYEDERLGIRMCHHPKRFTEDCINFNMHEEKEIKESEKPFKEPIDGVLYAATCGIKNKEQIEESEKPVPKDLEEAAEEYKQGEIDTNVDYHDETGEPLCFMEALKPAFIKGAEWQKEKDDTLIKKAHDFGFGAGTVWQKVQMMNEAVEGEITNAGGEFGYDVASFRFDENHTYTVLLPHEEGRKHGDKVKLIVVKGD